MRLSIVSPCFNEEAVLPETERQLTALLDDLIARDIISDDSEILFVDDGSSDRTWTLIRGFAETHPHTRGLKLSRNRGHQPALIATVS